jgi:7-cyano-7-deazaguanine reductase
MKPGGRAEQSPLGKATAYREDYAPELLFPVARAEQRAGLGLIAGSALPFFGHDLWNAYELSWLDPRGKPVVALAEFVVPAESPRLIESKSFKLYLNSFNQERVENVEVLTETLCRDLSAAAGAPVEARVMPLNEQPERQMAPPPGTLLDRLEIEVDTYTPAPQLLQAGGAVVEETLHSHLLKSNCLITGQPDWGSLVVRYRGRRIDHAGLLRYLISFRRHNEFHEHCVERMFCDITQRCQPERLEVWARYTRRGGLDINPWRSSHDNAPPPNLAEVRQ